MKKAIAALHAFLETKTGLLLLGFLVTTVGGSYLSMQMQRRTSENEHTFEMYKMRLREAKELQQRLLTASNARAFPLLQVLGQLAHPAANPRDAVRAYWKLKVSPANAEWNRDLYYFDAQTRALFSRTLSDMLVVAEENKPIVEDPEIREMVRRDYERTMPKTLHGALVDAHATIYALLWKCNDTEKCDPATLTALTGLATKQMEHLTLIQTCFTDRISAELLQYPYGPKKLSAIELPKECGQIASVD